MLSWSRGCRRGFVLGRVGMGGWGERCIIRRVERRKGGSKSVPTWPSKASTDAKHPSPAEAGIINC